MKIAPTIEGGLRIDPETDEDWYILRAIVLDANNCETDLASRLGDLVTDEKLAEDWQDIVVPDLRESFSDALHYIQGSLEAASAFPKDGEHPIWITREDAFTWYSALNQARLALEERFHFGPDPASDAANLTPLRHEALLRSHFYSALQSFILDHALG
ncbi:MAG: hypothetical protein NWT08_15335 [Akkermansiaceae bacterium]|jgi:hypothetical protein|nr:hypothetical protein [Akkermansiaceae bacterium]MDP4646517.1 hypothetical protein [Akkermansiaceae bacterium]MDP4720486.1 hypothetical protein [Akkermansiaceae bacterium]MDP4779322.1 hypothetical protein [Akkermansiaceae bacterium]MDP4846486.1 hypothetical protein [Akkermansiaceae bacterium]